MIGYKNRSQLVYDKDIFRTASLWITNSKGDVLLTQRSLNKKVEPGKWSEAVGGTVEGRDSYEQTIIREAEEELGISGKEFVVGPKQFVSSTAKYFVQWYTVVINMPIESFRIQQDEIESIAWIPQPLLIKDLDVNPHKYIAPMRDIVNLFKAL